MTILSYTILIFSSFGFTSSKTTTQETGKPMDAKKMFSLLEGKWKGNCKTWFEPGKLADESEVQGEFTRVFGGNFIRHSYTGSMKGKKRTGEETIVFNPIAKEIEISWMDTFHINYSILYSTGTMSETGFSVKGKYDAAPGAPKWGWKTVYEFQNDDRLIITSYNVTPDGEEAKGVELIYERVKE